MAKDSSFDVVSQVDMQEVDNAYQQTARELTQRYDLKDSGATIDLSLKRTRRSPSTLPLILSLSRSSTFSTASLSSAASISNPSNGMLRRLPLAVPYAWWAASSRASTSLLPRSNQQGRQGHQD